MYNAVAENVLATAGTVCWCIQLIPQIIRNYKVKDCTGFPPMMMFLWAASGIPFSIYFLATDGSIPLRIQPQLFTFFCLISWAQALYYPPVQLPKKKLIPRVASFVLISVGLEVGLILWLRPLYRRGIEYPMLIVGIIASILLAVGLVPPYFELWKRKGRVVGINFVFLFVDSLGALLSMCSILVGTFDVLSMVLYAIVLALELGIFGSQIVWYITGGRKIIKQEKLEARRLKEAEAEKASNFSQENESSDSTQSAIFVDQNNVINSEDNEINEKGK
ncbi:uncharacterized membrane protein [[Candida] jaroonii]|uniref:Uncharacterized membrane protein n=1 Tax=[Candida] jaroonii TaxID=467808 RepID=A0ACA9Y229_9ASCO|nr:uncharacterized membrane protein [[Candida] jaroonii]